MTRLVLAPLLLAPLLLAGCSGPSKVEYARAYPLDKVQTQTADIQAQRFETELRITNTAARNLGPGTIWVNQQWAHPLDGLEIGETVTLSLHDFANEYSERFRAGGFFATERPDTVMQVQYEANDGSELLGMVAVGKRER
jgi:hypothetical protein